ncbi:hypothetical protein [Hymenobacter yonginensis]|uniref:STAS/SEC14 domain-containing protein n=1 Tax=Hymenobacter yonginensis TaxID=748197 RepID=A0ABY7PSS6_9BACT|nr:hypothetical protein [Hymenobacter yonginensis]WBO85963.1 hypothetical protein O9Z63_06840 [Hymenobacter yonginensis]
MNKLVYPYQKSLYFHNSLANIIEHPGRYVQVEWQPTPMFSVSLREVHEQLLQLLKESQLSKVLSDNQMMPAIMPHDQDWLATDWAPRAVQESGYRYCAIINSHDVYNRLATTDLVHRVRGSVALRVSHFQDYDSAARWLLSSTMV